jgi:hypothetical protein
VTCDPSREPVLLFDAVCESKLPIELPSLYIPRKDLLHKLFLPVHQKAATVWLKTGNVAQTGTLEFSKALV